NFQSERGARWAPHANHPVNLYTIQLGLTQLVVVVRVDISSGMEADVLAIQRCISHQTALVVDEDFHAIAELCGSSCAGLEGNGRNIGAKRQAIVLEFLECVLVLEDDQLFIGLSTGQGTNRRLIDRGIADHLAIGINDSAAKGATDHETAFADIGEHDVGVGIIHDVSQPGIASFHRLEACFRVVAKRLALILALGLSAASSCASNEANGQKRKQYVTHWRTSTKNVIERNRFWFREAATQAAYRSISCLAPSPPRPSRRGSARLSRVRKAHAASAGSCCIHRWIQGPRCRGVKNLLFFVHWRA